MTDNNSGSKADGLNLAEIRRRTLGDAEGGQPVKPKRKRGYHRALKRGETWALVEKGMRDMLNESVKALYNAIGDEHCHANQIWGINMALFHSGTETEKK